MLEELKGIIKDACPETDVSKITEETVLSSELGMDSLRMMLLTIEIEKHYGLKIENFPPVKTVGDLCSFIEDSRASQK